MKDPFVLFPREKGCPCQSGLMAGVCCFREHPPLTCEEVRFNSLDVEMKLADKFGRTRKLPHNVEVRVEVNQPGQVENQIEKITEAALRKIECAPDVDPMKALELWRPFTKRVTAVSEAMYSCRYHQIQFIFRLEKVVKQQILDFRPPKSRHMIRIHDRPLRIELESFLISTISSLDALAELVRVSLGIGKNQDSFKRLADHLKLHHADQKKQAMQDIVCTANDSWAQSVRDIRNRIVHEASFTAFQGVWHKSMLVLDAEISDVPAGEFAVRTWRQLRELCAGVIELAPSYRVGFNS